MNLQNKKTGEIGTLLGCERNDITKNREIAVGVSNSDRWYKYLAELNDEVEDYEEPKGYWYIDCAAPYPVDFCEFNEDTEDDKAIGNYFETEEEAEKAVDKLKAWKRLKDEGFMFNGYDVAEPVGDEEFCGHAFFSGGNYSRDEIKADLDLLFGGEE